MVRFRPTPRFNPLVLSLLIAFGLLGPSIEPSRASWPSTASETESAQVEIELSSATKVECVTPDGRLVPVLGAGPEVASLAASMTDPATFHCSLQKGGNTFIISFPNASLVDRFMFVNDNAEVQGNMRIAVSDHRWPANSPKWTEVSGKTEFSGRRLFNLSMIGVEARFVKLSFRVEKDDQIATAQFEGADQ
jgi:hypothetical protein